MRKVLRSQQFFTTVLNCKIRLDGTFEISNRFSENIHILSIFELFIDIGFYWKFYYWRRKNVGRCRLPNTFSIISSILRFFYFKLQIFRIFFLRNIPSLSVKFKTNTESLGQLSLCPLMTSNLVILKVSS